MILTKGSLFTGAMGADLGAEEAGIISAWYCEIDPAAAGVIAYHRPGSRIYGDITKFKPDPIKDAVDIIIGGSPCQDLSVAGNRAGLAGERSGLFREMVRICKRLHPRFVVWENVPGALSSNEGRDFAAVIRAFTGLQVEVPENGWGNSGFVRSPFPEYRWHVAWRVLDSQYLGVPQRRRRIFLVGSLGAASCIEILFEPESVSGNPPPSREKGQEVAGAITSRASGGGGGPEVGDGAAAGYLQIATLTGDPYADRASEESKLILDTARCLSTSNQRIDAETETLLAVAHTLRGDGFDASEDGTGRDTPLVVTPILQQAVAYRTSGNSGVMKQGDKTAALNTATDPTQNIVAFSSKDYGSDAGDIAPTLRSMGHDKSHPNAGGQVAVAFNLRGREEGAMPEVSETASVRSASGGSSRSYVAFAENQRGEIRESDTHPQLTTGGGKPGQGFPAVRGQTGVRRLTPVECERLQGWPDHHTLRKLNVKLVDNQWVTIKPQPVKQADGPRYKQIGNGVTRNVMKWICLRIRAVAEKGGKSA